MPTEDRKRAYIYFAVGAIIIGGILGGNAWRNSQPKPNQDDGCLRTVSGKTVILIDHSEVVTAQTKAEMVARAAKFVAEKTDVGDLVSVFTVSDLSTKKLQPLFAYCKPKSDGNTLYENPRKVEKDFKTKFEIPLRNALDTKIADGHESPIAQAIIDLTLSDFMRGAERTNLLVFSDLLEHTKAFSMYKCVSAKTAINDFRKSRPGAVQRPAFKDVAVYTHVIPRTNVTTASVACRDGFWVWFFGDNPGPNAKLIPDNLPG